MDSGEWRNREECILPERQPQFRIMEMVEVQANPNYIGLVRGVEVITDDIQQIGHPTIKTYEYTIQCSHCGHGEPIRERWLRKLPRNTEGYAHEQ